MANGTCAVCPEPVAGNRKYCSEKCKWEARPRIPCSSCGGPTGFTKRASKSEVICNRCRKKAPGEHGSDRMYNKLKCRCESCKAWASARGREYRERTGYKAPKRKPTKTITCAYPLCDKQTKVRSGSRTRYCSIKCGKKHIPSWNKRSTELVLYTGPKFIRIPRPNINPVPPITGRFKGATCKVCTKAFITLNMDITCSDECQKKNARATKDRRRARKRDAFVENVYRSKVFEADGWRCHICRRKTLPAKQVPHPRAPTIDHLIPLAKGGTHEPSNCRTACFQCNCIKSDRGSGDQLILAV